MNIFKYATINKLRVPTEKGALSAEQLIELPIKQNNKLDLTTVALNLDKKLKQQSTTNLDFLNESINVDEKLQAQFDLIKEIIKHKQSENKTKTEEAANKYHNDKIDALIIQKQEEHLKNLSVEDLQKLKK